MVMRTMVAALVFVAPAALGADGYRAEVDKHIGPLIEAGFVPGAMVGVHKDGETFFYSVGSLRPDGTGTPSEETLYEIGSISKVVTGVLLADAVRRGEVSYETTVDELLPGGKGAKAVGGVEVTLAHLTTHTSGWGTMPINFAPTDPERPFVGYTDAMMFRAAGAMTPKQEPGTVFEYSNFGVGLLGTLVALNAGEGYEALVTERVLDPLGIDSDDFTIGLDGAQLDRLAPGVASGVGVKNWETMGPMDPAGMWVATAPGLMEFALANLGDGDGAIFESLEIARRPIDENAFGGKVCSGWMIAADGSTYWHNGQTGGYSSYLAVNRAFGLAVVVLTNGANGYSTAAGELLVVELAGLDPDPVDLSGTVTPEDVGEPLVGTYDGAFFDVDVTYVRGRLYARLTNQGPVMVVPEDEDGWFSYIGVDARLHFDYADDGSVASVTLHQNGMEMKCERVED